MSRGNDPSPLHAKAKRRQSDAKWRASVATCYDALRYVVPNVKTMKKRKISKALILQESERHIKELEAAVTHLLGVESRRRGKSVMWKEGLQWSACSLNKLRMDFSQKQEKVFHMASHGRRCYNLLQDIKEEVFAMEADPSHIAVLQHSDASAHRAVPCASTSGSTQMSTRRVNLVVANLNGASSTTQSCGQSSIAEKFSTIEKGKAYSGNFTNIADRNPPKVSTSAYVVTPQSYQRLAPSSVVTLKIRTQPGNTRFAETASSSTSSLPTPSVSAASFAQSSRASVYEQSVPNCTSSTSSSSGISISRTSSASARVSTSLAGSQQTVKSQPLSYTRNTFYHSSLLEQNLQEKASSQVGGSEDLNPPSTSGEKGSIFSNVTASQSRPGQRLRIGVANVAGEFYILSDALSSIAHLLKLRTSESKSQSENKTEQEVPSMKLPLKRPEEPVKKEIEESSQKDTLTGMKETMSNISKDRSVLDMNSSGSSSGMAVERQDVTEHWETEDPLDLYTVTVGEQADPVATPNTNDMLLPPSSDIKEEVEDIVTPQNDRDPLLSSLTTPRLNERTPLFVRAENNMVVKRRPRPGTARKKLNFGACHSTTPDKEVKTVTGFTPVKLPGCDADTAYLDSFISPWKIVNSPSFEPRLSPSNCLDNPLVCMENIEAMDLGEDDDNSGHVQVHSVGQRCHPVPSTETHTGKRKFASPIHQEEELGPKPKCRRKLDGFYDVPVSSWCDDDLTSTNTEEEDAHTVPNIYSRVANKKARLDSGLEDDNMNDDEHETYEESHLVPELGDALCKDGDVFDNDATHDFNMDSAASRNDFDGFYYYYRLISQQLKEKDIRKGSGNGENGSTIDSSPSMAARIAHMWTCLPLQDKLTMATLASLEEENRELSVCDNATLPGEEEKKERNVLNGVSSLGKDVSSSSSENQALLKEPNEQPNLAGTCFISPEIKCQVYEDITPDVKAQIYEDITPDFKCGTYEEDIPAEEEDAHQVYDDDRDWCEGHKTVHAGNVCQTYGGTSANMYETLTLVNNTKLDENPLEVKDLWENDAEDAYIGHVIKSSPTKILADDIYSQHGNLEDNLYQCYHDSVVPVGDLSEDLRDVNVQPLEDHTYNNSANHF